MFKGSSSGERDVRAKIQRQEGSVKGHGVCVTGEGQRVTFS